MRFRVILLMVATSSLVLVSFLVPLALVLRTFAANRAVSTATNQAQTLALLVTTTSASSLQLAVTRVNARTPGRESDYETWGWGQTTSREMARLVTLIRQGKVVSPAASEEMYRTLTRSFWTGEALSQLPPTVQAASKQGAVDQSRSEVVLVNAPSGDYVFCVITKNQQDESMKPENEGYVLLRRVSALLWRRFEPRHPWSPAAGAAAFKP